MSNISSTTIPLWLTKARDAVHQQAVFAELSKREKQRQSYRNAPPPQNNDKSTSPSRKPLPGKAIPSSSEEPDLTKYYSVAIGRDPNNRWGNRYSNIEPYDRTRVVVGTSRNACLGCGDSQGRYFNGSWVKELHGGKWWIATQAPLRNTAHSFLSVLSQPIGLSSDTSFPKGSRVHTVVQLTLNVENGRIKAHPYFPFTVGETMTVSPEPGTEASPFVVTLKERIVVDEANCIQSKVSFVPQNDTAAEPITFTHLLYVAWPDHGIPEESDRASLLNFLRLVDQVNKAPQSPSAPAHPDPPIMANCSAGVGRTGTFIAISSLLRYYNLLDPGSATTHDTSLPAPKSRSLLEPISLDSDSVAQEIDNLREQRPDMVQRNEQISLVYQILEQGFLGK